MNEDEDKDNGLEDILDNDPRPNIILTYPVFYLPKFPDDLFVIETIFWVSLFEDEITEEITRETKDMISRATKQVYEMEQIGIKHDPSRLWKLRDMDKPLLPSTISAAHIPDPIKTFLISGPRYEKRAIENKLITVH